MDPFPVWSGYGPAPSDCRRYLRASPGAFPSGIQEIGFDRANDEIGRLPEELLSAVLAKTTARDASRAAAVSQPFRAAADSDAVWTCFVPALTDEELEAPAPRSKKELFFLLLERPVLLQDGLMAMWLDRETLAKCYMLSARKLFIASGDMPQHWSWIPLSDSRFSQGAQLIRVTWFEIQGQIHRTMLSPNSTEPNQNSTPLFSSSIPLRHSHRRRLPLPRPPRPPPQPQDQTATRPRPPSAPPRPPPPSLADQLEPLAHTLLTDKPPRRRPRAAPPQSPPGSIPPGRAPRCCPSAASAAARPPPTVLGAAPAAAPRRALPEDADLAPTLRLLPAPGLPPTSSDALLLLLPPPVLAQDALLLAYLRGLPADAGFAVDTILFNVALKSLHRATWDEAGSSPSAWSTPASRSTTSPTPPSSPPPAAAASSPKAVEVVRAHVLPGSAVLPTRSPTPPSSTSTRSSG
ncbi:hypothetical protein ZWY2020_019503 [Hordeum vulgare]|nr:hypothetical protein ZWY2020_019503 [Hordeum vulgare]